MKRFKFSCNYIFLDRRFTYLVLKNDLFGRTVGHTKGSLYLLITWGSMEPTNPNIFSNALLTNTEPMTAKSDIFRQFDRII